MQAPLHTIIFYTDDDADDLGFFKEATNEMPVSVSLFEEGEKMLRSLYNSPPPPSVIFLDLNMPVKSGVEILNEIKSEKTLNGIPVVILTTSANPEDISECKKRGANLYIQKPTSIDALKKAIAYVLTIDWKNNGHPGNFFYQHS